MPAPQKRRLKGYLNINSNDAVAGWFSSRFDADQTASPGRVACLDLADYNIEYQPD